ncbi:MAG: DNA mismatch repair endonuclease MutL [Planctomycetota bacterium]|nr:DNA mismatch repair endonuclease MutL [Planctomycetota bacterium]
MSPKINILPEVVQNKIAAGEVIERPASVVKELVENALDAGAQNIRVEIANGGQDLIRVADDGAGMDADNLALCVERHATSKIRDVDDIFHVTTMGFRGEALPSIGAVAQLTIVSGTTASAESRALTVAGGKREPLRPAPPRRGTIVEVRRLFFNTPARRKFMKSPSAETALISETLTRLALAYPAVGFTLENHGNRTLQLPAAPDARARLVALFGNLPLLPVAYADHGLTIAGFVAAPPESRPNARTIYTFLNRRWFKHAGLARALADAFAGNLPPRRYPFAVLDFTIDPAKVDVNAHPTKEVIRFENEQILLGGAHHAVRAALGNAGGYGAGYAPVENPNAHPVQEAVADYLSAHSAPPAGNNRPSANGNSNFNGAKFSPPRAGQAPPPSRTNDTGSGTKRGENLGENFSAARPLLAGGNWRYVGQVGDKYLVVETADGMLLVDPHALHERYNYERLQERPATIVSQQLLTPLTVELSPSEAGQSDAALPVLRDAGFAVTVADGKLSIAACPDFITAEQAATVCRDVLAQAAETLPGVAPYAALLEKMRAKIACHSAVLFGAGLATDAALDLLAKLLNHNLPTCPHGRPTTILLTWTELAGKFAR